MKMERLRDLKIDDETFAGMGLRNYGLQSGLVEVVFDRHAERLCALIKKYEFAVGCVAWLTHPHILEALSTVHTQIVVQKEDFLRPDALKKSQLQRAYQKISSLDRFDLPGLASHLSSSGDPSTDGVRCVGYRSTKGKSTSPRMHHKFLVLGKIKNRGYEPSCVWTGSYNFTNNAERSLENAVIISDAVVAEAYLQEWAQVFALSESLDWSSEYVEPEWRVGT